MAAPNQNDVRRERDDPGFFEKSMEDRVAATTEDVDHLHGEVVHRGTDRPDELDKRVRARALQDEGGAG